MLSLCGFFVCLKCQVSDQSACWSMGLAEWSSLNGPLTTPLALKDAGFSGLQLFPQQPPGSQHFPAGPNLWLYLFSSALNIPQSRSSPSGEACPRKPNLVRPKSWEEAQKTADRIPRIKQRAPGLPCR